MKNTKINNNNRTNWNSELRPTNHFNERYNSRVMNNPNGNISFNNIILDMDKKLTDKEKNILSLFKSSKKVIVPMRNFEIVIKNKILITIY